MADGHGIRREDVMVNTFEILGPAEDPARAGRADGAAAALRLIAQSGSRFVSRGDDSGTHKKELALWEASGGRPQWDGYVESGQAMGPTLVMTDQMTAYTLADRGSYLNFRSKIGLVSLVQSPEELANPYGILVVDPAKHPAIQVDLAHAFVDFLISPRAQSIIRDYAVDGEPLFFPLHLSGKDASQ